MKPALNKVVLPLFIAQLLFPIPGANGEAQKGSIQQSTLYSCQAALNGYNFQCEEGNWPCTCEYAPLAASVIECMDLYLPSSVDRVSGHIAFIKACWKFTQTDISLEDVAGISANASEYFVDTRAVNSSTPVFVPLRLHREDVQNRIRDYRAFLGNFDDSQRYGIIINMYWVVMITWFAMCNKLKKTRWNEKIVSRRINFLRANISLPLLFGSHQTPFNMAPWLTTLLPTFGDSLVLLGYFALNVFFLFHNYKITENNQLFGPNSNTLQTARYLADRAGVLSFAHFPLLVLFAGRNNILIGFSELPYATFMIFHKWTARVMVVHATLHTLAYLWMLWYKGSFAVFIHEWWFVMGVLAIVLGVLILLFAAHYFRVRFYEWFLVSHIVFALLFFISCWEHCVTFGWLDWIACAFAFWITDRLIRIYRLARFGAPRATIEHISDDTFKVSVKRPHNWKPYPGCFVFIHFLHWSIFWQSHPFTIVDSVLEDEQVTIYIKAKDGLTGQIAKLLSHTGQISMRVSLEGPYGNQSPCENYENVILFAGGNGIPGPFYHALHLAEGSRLLPKSKIRLIWIIRSVDSIKWFEPELKRLCRTKIQCDIYITRDFEASMVRANPLLSQFKHHITFHSGRAPSAKILHQEFELCSSSLAIVTCGPGMMCDEIRHVVAKSVEDVDYRVDLFEELQVW